MDTKEEPEIPVLRAVKTKAEPSMEGIKSIAEKHITNDARLMRSAAIYLSRKYTQKTLNEIASFFGAIKYTGVSQAWRRMEIRRGKDENIERLLANMEAVIAKSVM